MIPQLNSNQTEKKRNLLTEPLSLSEATVEIVGQDGEHASREEAQAWVRPSASSGTGMVFGISTSPSPAARLARCRHRPRPAPVAPRLASDRRSSRAIRLPGEGIPEVRNIDQRQQQTCDPEDVHMGEKGEQAQHGDDFELKLMGLCAMRSGKYAAAGTAAPGQHGNDQNHGHDHHQDIRLAGGGDERRQMVGSGRIKR